MKDVVEHYRKAAAHRELYKTLFQDCYDYAIPYREGFDDRAPGQRNDHLIFDETAVVGTQEFASRLQAGIVPTFARWSELTAGSEVPPDQREEVNAQLAEVTDYVFEVLDNSNFAQEVHESFIDLAVGTGTLKIEEGTASSPVIFSAVPLPRVVLDTGPDDKVDTIFLLRPKVKYEDLPILYPDGNIPVMGDKECDVIEAVRRDYADRNDERYTISAHILETGHEIYSDEVSGIGSNPLIVYRWATCAGERYGRGPLTHALSAIKTTNLTVQLILENAQMAISGVYQYDADGVINPETIQLVPGTLIPVAPGSRGVVPLQNGSDFNVSQLILGDQRMNIKRALFNDMLGDPDKTPATATEVAERMADLYRRIGSSFGRLQVELVHPVLQRVIYILKKQGRIQVPSVNGREVKIKAVSPLAQAQANQDIASISRWMQTVGQTFGPEMLNLLVSGEVVAAHLAQKFGVPQDLLRSDIERRQIAAAMQQQAQAIAQQQQPSAPQPV